MQDDYKNFCVLNKVDEEADLTGHLRKSRSLTSLKIIPSMTFTRSEDMMKTGSEEINDWIEEVENSDDTLTNNSLRRPGVTYSDVVIKSSINEQESDTLLDISTALIPNSDIDLLAMTNGLCKTPNHELLNKNCKIKPFFPLDLDSAFPFMPVPEITDHEINAFDEALFATNAVVANETDFNCNVCTNSSYLLQKIIKTRMTRAIQEKNLKECQQIFVEQLPMHNGDLPHSEFESELQQTKHEFLPSRTPYCAVSCTYDGGINTGYSQQLQPSYKLSNPTYHSNTLTYNSSTHYHLPQKMPSTKKIF